MTRASWTDRVNVSLAAYPGRTCVEAMEVASQCPPSEPFLGPLKLDWTSPGLTDKSDPHAEAISKASGLTPPR